MNQPNPQQPQNRPPQGQGQPPQPNWRTLFWLPLLVLLAVAFVLGDWQQGGAQFESIPYSQFKEQVRAQRVASVTIRGEEVVGEYTQSYVERQEQSGKTEGTKAYAPSHFRTTLPSVDDPQLMTLLEEHDVTVRAESTEAAWWQEILVWMLPWIIILGLIFYASRKMQQRMMGGGGAGGPFGFGKTQAKRFEREGQTNVTFADVAGSQGAKRDLEEIIEYLREPGRYRALGASIPKGVLLMGPPGIGKTLLAKAVAGEADVPFFSISGSEFIEMFVGVGAARVRDTFKAAKNEAPAIIFIDELDSVGRARGAGLGGGHDEREQTLNQILSEMDGFAQHEAVVVMAATNRPDVLDQALMRPGRFDRKVVLDLPEKAARTEILKVHTRKVPLAGDVDLDTLAQRTVGFSGADLQNMVNEAALLAGREDKRKVDMDAFAKARDKIVLGDERESVLSDDERELIAYHESGHALMAWLLPEADPLDKVTIIPRGRALGATEQTPEEDRHNLKRGYLLDRITVMLGGRAAEKVVFGDVTTGAESDLKQATQLTRRMICQWGMNEELGPVTFSQGEEHVFLGRELAQQRDFSEETAKLIDDEVRNQVSRLEEKAEQLLRRHRPKLDALAKALLDKETVEGAELERLFKAAAA
ncbi:MAG: ATP-dependent zinc metalloprotease FtsH [Gammaproteobacteria bacterium]|nr:ATP-dependent zinc metalloprotease FtsH [Gammaproteobacteria bacterium]NIR86003.1 ATP-dependent zinc metalloprotease FtsH [Gammaproteobacteria bacterium]NIR92078.1 ATP-dependent zinc metalloprotease FtsH [Gammaproteobacteria bacterium]NIU07245.1 ATP-dependent zinc metalloprotease FtsH [Gammaproteobacteria bacterium]NIV54048.1 ATP-dependent zinc metalloprotease FtsH [Gammaproteobacteria bacterium]